MEYHIAVDRSRVRVSAVEKRPKGVYRVKLTTLGFQLYCEDDFRRTFRGSVFIENESGGYLASPLPKTESGVFSIQTIMRLSQHDKTTRNFFHFTKKFLSVQLGVHQLSEDSTFLASKSFGLTPSSKLYPFTARISSWAEFQSSFLSGKTLLLGSSTNPNELLDHISVLGVN